MLDADNTKFSRFVELTHFILVGDRFKLQAPDQRLISTSEATGLAIWLARQQDNSIIFHIWVGQGVADEEVEHLAQLIHVSNLNDQIILQTLAHHRRAAASLTHKHHPANILISEPYAIDNGDYLAYLRVNEACDDIRDHLTGQHLPGMLLAESARQMVIAVSEKFILPNDRAAQVAYVTHRQTVEFIDFIFPLEVQVLARLCSLRRSGTINFQASLEISFIQCGAICARSEFKFSCFDQCVLQAQERHQVNRAISHSLSVQLAAMAKPLWDRCLHYEAADRWSRPCRTGRGCTAGATWCRANDYR